MKILVFEIFEKGQILRPFTGLAPSTLKILMVAYVHIGYSTHQFSEESKGGGGGNPPPPSQSLRYRKKILKIIDKYIEIYYYQAIAVGRVLEQVRNDTFSRVAVYLYEMRIKLLIYIMHKLF